MLHEAKKIQNLKVTLQPTKGYAHIFVEYKLVDSEAIEDIEIGISLAKQIIEKGDLSFYVEDDERLYETNHIITDKTTDEQIKVISELITAYQKIEDRDLRYVWNEEQLKELEDWCVEEGLDIESLQYNSLGDETTMEEFRARYNEKDILELIENKEIESIDDLDGIRDLLVYNHHISYWWCEALGLEFLVQ